MSRIPVRVVGREPGEVLVQAETPCVSCAKACQQPETFRLTNDVAGTRLVVYVTMARHMSLALHSLLLPLAGFVGGAFFASLLSGNDFVALGFSVLGLISGVMLCRSLPLDSINVYEATPHE